MPIKLTSPADWLAFIALLATALFGLPSLVAFAWAAVKYVLVEAERRVQARRVRIQELAAVIYNLDGKYGLGAQLLAIDELSDFKKNKRAILRFAKSNKAHFKSVGASAEVISALEELEATLK